MRQAERSAQSTRDDSLLRRDFKCPLQSVAVIVQLVSALSVTSHEDPQQVELTLFYFLPVQSSHPCESNHIG